MMIVPPPQVRVFVRPGPTDMRKAFDGLFGIAKEIMKKDPLSGHLFVFCNKRRDRLKILFSDGAGLWVCAKRLEGGTFSWPTVNEASASVEMSSGELSMLLSGVEMKSVKHRKWRRFALANERS
jgi:transposase